MKAQATLACSVPQGSNSQFRTSKVRSSPVPKDGLEAWNNIPWPDIRSQFAYVHQCHHGKMLPVEILAALAGLRRNLCVGLVSLCSARLVSRVCVMCVCVGVWVHVKSDGELRMWIIVTAFFCKHTRQDCRFRWKPVVPELGDSIHEADVVFARRCKGPNSVGQILSCARVCRFAPGTCSLDTSCGNL